MTENINENDICNFISAMDQLKREIEHEYDTFDINVKVPNIGITLSNKLNFLSKEYNEHNLDFYHSHLFYPIMTSLSEFIKAALDTLEEFQSNNHKINKRIFFSKRKVINNLQNLKPFLEKYNDIDNQLYHFSLKKNLITSILYDMFLKMDDKDSVYMNDPDIFSKYEQEMIDLGLGEETINNFRNKMQKIMEEYNALDEEKILTKK